jgi:hypothetical protein
MTAAKSRDPQNAIGRSPDSLTLEERLAFAGKFVAYEIYTPKTLPLRTIDAIGDSLAECLRILKQRGLDPERYEFQILHPPY